MSRKRRFVKASKLADKGKFDAKKQLKKNNIISDYSNKRKRKRRIVLSVLTLVICCILACISNFLIKNNNSNVAQTFVINSNARISSVVKKGIGVSANIWNQNMNDNQKGESKKADNQKDESKKDDSLKKDKKKQKKEETKPKKEKKKKKKKNSDNEGDDRKPNDDVKAQWVHYTSKGNNYAVVAKVDGLVKSWCAGAMSNQGLRESMLEILDEKDIEYSALGITSKRKCLFESIKDIPNYSAMVKKSKDPYYFIGLYTEGKYDKNGNLICYYWEVGVM